MGTRGEARIAFAQCSFAQCAFHVRCAGIRPTARDRKMSIRFEMDSSWFCYTQGSTAHGLSEETMSATPARPPAARSAAPSPPLQVAAAARSSARTPDRPRPSAAMPRSGRRRGRRPGRGAGARGRLLLARHGLTLLRGRLLRWRLETFGIYAPSLPQARPWWRLNGRMALLLLRRSDRYARWLEEMRALRRDGPEGWWQQTGRDTARAIHAYIEQTNRNEEDAP